MTTAEKLRLAVQLHNTGVQLKKQQLKRRHPKHSEVQIMAQLYEWLQQTPALLSGGLRLKTY